MNKAEISLKRVVIPTYPSPKSEEYPMFAENRVHQRSSGRPYPNKVVMKVDREHRVDREYTLVTLENKYIKVEILPEIGGRIYSALDKTTGYDFFYKQHVIKPALIGVLGSWISGGVEFNWPFHHRASGFMPCDFYTEELADGSVACWLSEHDPIDRMKGMVGIILHPDCAYFETRMKLYNRTADEKSFLWWENAAVPVNEDYQIFFPPDVRYVNFHYLKSRISYPVAEKGSFNGIPMIEPRDISLHKNTRQATSYFASASEYDFFGGYDNGKACGVVHIGDHHISPGKKMFTWAYDQLSKSWEKALTDTDGQYAELMAGSYSDNQPNFSWLAPYETKEFSQYWYPIAGVGAPSFANLDCAMRIDRKKGLLSLTATKEREEVLVTLEAEGRVYLEERVTLTPSEAAEIALPDLPEFVTVTLSDKGGVFAEYTEQDYSGTKIPEVITDMPEAAAMADPEEIYLAGVHVDQYRDPAVYPDVYWKRALELAPNHVPSLISMAEYEYRLRRLYSALDYADKAVGLQNTFNERHKRGEAYYVRGKILEAMGDIKGAYDTYYKAAFAADAAGKAMTRIALIDVKRGDYSQALRHAETALDYGRKNNLAAATAFLAQQELGLPLTHISGDPLDHLARFIKGDKDFYHLLDSDPVQTCLDLAADLDAMGRYGDIVRLLEGIENKNQPALYTLGYYKFQMGLDGGDCYAAAEAAELGEAFPLRDIEERALRHAIEKTHSEQAKMLLGCLLYSRQDYSAAARLWQVCGDKISKRNLAVAYFSHLNKKEEALELMKALCAAHPEDEELTYEAVCLMDKMSVEPREKIDFINSHKVTRDDILIELAKAYNQADLPDEAIGTLMSHSFVPCEGGEHAIADQYMLAYMIKGKKAQAAGDYIAALRLYTEGLTLPQSLGAGVWNHTKRVPLKYHIALCLDALGRGDEAADIYRYISEIKLEYFSNMYLKELPFYQALSLERLGRNGDADALAAATFEAWDKIKEVRDNGYFATTPFFIPFVDEAATMRRAQHLFLTGLIGLYKKEPSAGEKLAESLRLNSDNMAAVFWANYR